MKPKKLISKCCMCGKVKDESHDFSNSWGFHEEQLERYYSDFDLMHTHGFCDECYKRAEEELDRWLKENVKESSQS